jgi:uncharacterized repeat protein (TIGR04138 family)
VGLPDEIHALAIQDGRYAPEAFRFLFEALEHAVQHTGREQSEGTARHVSGREVLDSLRRLALETFGPLGAEVWRRWGIRSTLDWGRVVFLLVDAGLLRRQDSDTLEDFRDGYDLDTELAAAYQPQIPASLDPLREA